MSWSGANMDTDNVMHMGRPWSALMDAAGGIAAEGLKNITQRDLDPKVYRGPTEMWMSVESALKYKRDIIQTLLVEHITWKNAWHVRLLPPKHHNQKFVKVVVVTANQAGPVELPQYVPAPIVTTRSSETRAELIRIGLGLEVDTESFLLPEAQQNFYAKVVRVASSMMNAMKADVIYTLHQQPDFVLSIIADIPGITPNERIKRVMMSKIKMFGILNQDTSKAITGFDCLMGKVHDFQQRRILTGLGGEIDTVLVPSGILQSPVFQQESLFLQDRPTFQDTMAATVGRDDGPNKGRSRYSKGRVKLFGYTSTGAFRRTDPSQERCFIATWVPMQCQFTSTPDTRTIKITDGVNASYKAISLYDAVAHCGFYQDDIPNPMGLSTLQTSDDQFRIGFHDGGYYRSNSDSEPVEGVCFTKDVTFGGQHVKCMPAYLFGMMPKSFFSKKMMLHMAGNITTAANILKEDINLISRVLANPSTKILPVTVANGNIYMWWNANQTGARGDLRDALPPNQQEILGFTVQTTEGTEFDAENPFAPQVDASDDRNQRGSVEWATVFDRIVQDTDRRTAFFNRTGTASAIDTQHITCVSDLLRASSNLDFIIETQSDLFRFIGAVERISNVTVPSLNMVQRAIFVINNLARCIAHQALSDTATIAYTKAYETDTGGGIMQIMTQFNRTLLNLHCGIADDDHWSANQDERDLYALWKQPLAMIPGECHIKQYGFTGFESLVLCNYMRSENTLPNIRDQITRGLDFPMHFRIIRPNIQVQTASVVFARSGEETGNIYWMLPFTASASDPLKQLEQMQVTLYTKAVVRNPYNVLCLHHAHICDILSGFGTSWMQPQEYRGLMSDPRHGGRDMFALAVPISETGNPAFCDQNVVCITNSGENGHLSSFDNANDVMDYEKAVRGLVPYDADCQASEFSSNLLSTPVEDGQRVLSAPYIATRGTFMSRNKDGTWTLNINEASHLKGYDSVNNQPTGLGSFLDNTPTV